MLSISDKIEVYLQELGIQKDFAFIRIVLDDAIAITKDYMNNPDFTNEDIESRYGNYICNAVVKTISDKENLKNNNNCKSITQGKISMSFNDVQTNLKKNLRTELPNPYMRFL